MQATRDMIRLPESISRKHAVAYLLAVAGALMYLSPLYAGFTTSFKTQTAFAETLPTALPPSGGFTLEPWIVAWQTLSPAMWNSLLFTLPAMVFSAVLGSIAAFGLTMVDWRGQIALMSAFIMANFLPKQAILVPLSQFWSVIGLESILANLGIMSLWFVQSKHVTILTLIITHTCYGIAICTLLFRGYYLTIDQDLIEAAQIDGSNIYNIYRTIILPLSYPMFMVVFIFQFTQIYNEFLYALILVGGTSPSTGAPVTLVLNDLNSGYAVLYNHQMAGAFIAAIPTIIVYVLFGEQFAEGVKY
ncbi:carbohydrate ABC transporter permease [Halopenitus sp. H-Gu1]|uniref:carbohydrate ABC transporter permease n=1 Tax=Halopenitus sp. H-Gu1 TaxID=3242697 RepID=UPI00359D2ED7